MNKIGISTDCNIFPTDVNACLWCNTPNPRYSAKANIFRSKAGNLVMSLDPTTILGISIIAALLIGAVLLAFEFGRQQKMPHLRMWALASLLQALGLTVVAALRQALPYSLGILAGNALIMGALTFYLRVVADYAGRPMTVWKLAAINFLHLSALAVFLYIWPNVSARIAIFSAFAALVMAAGALKLFRYAGAQKPAERLTAVLFGTGAAAMLVRALLQYPFTAANLNPLESPGSYASIFHVVLLLVNLSFTLGFFLICVDRYQNESQAAAQRATENSELFRKQFEMLPVSACVWRISGDDFVLERANFAAQVMTEGKIWSLTGTTASTYHADEPQILSALYECRDHSVYLSREIPRRLNPEAVYAIHNVTFNRISPELIAVYTEVKN